MGLNKVSTRAVFLGNMEEDELECLIEGKKTLFDFRSERVFKRLDQDNSGALDKEEVRDYLMEAMGDDWDDKEFESEYRNTFNVSLDDNDDTTTLEEWKVIYKKMAVKILEDM